MHQLWCTLQEECFYLDFKVDLALACNHAVVQEYNSAVEKILPPRSMVSGYCVIPGVLKPMMCLGTDFMGHCVPVCDRRVETLETTSSFEEGDTMG